MEHKRAILVGAATAGFILMASHLLSSGKKQSVEQPQEAKTAPEPTCLADMGYHFKTFQGAGDDHKRPAVTEKTRLVSLKDGSAFKFEGPAHYDKVAKFVRAEVMTQLKAAGLEEIQGKKADQLVSARARAKTTCRPRVFHTPNALEAKTLLVIIQGSGAVRTGQWAQRLCVSNSLQEGSALPFIAKAKAEGWGVLLLDPNYADKTDSVPQQVSAVEHVLSAWDALLAPNANQRLLFVAHSAGGRAIMSLLRHRGVAFMSRTAGVAMTDAVHPEVWAPFTLPADVTTFLATKTLDWVASEKPLGTAVPQEEDVLAQGMRPGTVCGDGDAGDPIPLVSAGHRSHIWTSFMAMEQIFDFLKARLQ